ncbi:MAG: hypothetical protein LBV50_08025 [Novosphingobium sp.]|jgi:hypothetical protein|nr:hypothetical protein [Novosphingobium sp.]
MSLDKAIADAINTIPECVAGGYVDMSMGMLLGYKTLDSHPQEVLDLVAAATRDLFEGSIVKEIEQSFARSRGLQGTDFHYFQEMLIFSENLLHVFIRTKREPMHAACFVCRKSANVGMVLARSRMAIDKLVDAALA